MFVYRYYKDKDMYNNEYSGFEVGFICTEFDEVSKLNKSKFCRIATFASDIEAAEYCHWLNGGSSYKYDNVRTEN